MIYCGNTQQIINNENNHQLGLFEWIKQIRPRALATELESMLKYWSDDSSMCTFILKQLQEALSNS